MRPRKKRQLRPLAYLLIAVVFVISYVTWAILRPMPDLAPAVSNSLVEWSAGDSKLVWPANGKSAVGVLGGKEIQANGLNTELPIASTAKIITALAVLDKKPLKLNEQGPIITLGPVDVAIYNGYAAHDGSVVKVVNGEQISEYQMLQTIMLPSANNMADSMAIWAFGSLPNYNEYAKSYLKSIGVNNTHLGVDASGLDPTTTSTATDLVKIGKKAMQNPVLAQIVGQSTATGIPVVGTIKNVNFLLGSHGIVGVKTGNTDEAGGVFVSASKVKVNGQDATVVTSVLGAPDLFSSMSQTVPLVDSAANNFQSVTLLKQGHSVGIYPIPWGGGVRVLAGYDLTLEAFGGTKAKTITHLNYISAKSIAGQTVGHVKGTTSDGTDTKTVPAILQDTVTKPSIKWRLSHPF